MLIRFKRMTLKDSIEAIDQTYRCATWHTGLISGWRGAFQEGRYTFHTNPDFHEYFDQIIYDFFRFI